MDKWQNIQDTSGGEPCNLLEAFYKNPERYAYTFQNYVFVTRLMQARRLLSARSAHNMVQSAALKLYPRWLSKALLSLTSDYALSGII